MPSWVLHLITVITVIIFIIGPILSPITWSSHKHTPYAMLFNFQVHLLIHSFTDSLNKYFLSNNDMPSVVLEKSEWVSLYPVTNTWSSCLSLNPLDWPPCQDMIRRTENSTNLLTTSISENGPVPKQLLFLLYFKYNNSSLFWLFETYL